MTFEGERRLSEAVAAREERDDVGVFPPYFKHISLKTLFNQICPRLAGADLLPCTPLIHGPCCCSGPSKVESSTLLLYLGLN
ncbi:hypothetical protein QYF36_026560 [Acer negundo]|nr:hypothetical protein QYF36_026560 [Acer negundo]